MVYRICKSIELESGHLLSKHPGNCKFPHGHTRSVEMVFRAETLDANDMVLDRSSAASDVYKRQSR